MNSRSKKRSLKSPFHDPGLTMGYDVWAKGRTSLNQEINEWLGHGSHCRTVSCLNPHSYAVARQDNEFHRALSHSDWLIPDGIGIAVASRFLGHKLETRITGLDLFYGLMHILDRRGGRVFLMGAAEETLKSMKKRIHREYPNVVVAGTISPPYRPQFSTQDSESLVRRINQARPDLLWVGMTAPKQEKWIETHRTDLDVKVAGSIGAVFDYYGGVRAVPGRTVRNLGLEWAVRLLQEPRRLYRRTFVSLPRFLWDMLCFRLGRTE